MKQLTKKERTVWFGIIRRPGEDCEIGPMFTTEVGDDSQTVIARRPGGGGGGAVSNAQAGRAHTLPSRERK